MSDETSFCSRCGLYLDFLESVMKNEGYPAAGSEAGGIGSWFSRRNVRLSALLWFVVVTAFLLPISAIMGGPSEMLAVLGLMGPVGAAFLLVASMFFPVSSNLPERRGSAGEIEGGRRRELPADRTVYAEDFVAPAGSDERPFAPVSVTEETTRHLDEKLKGGS